MVVREEFSFCNIKCWGFGIIACGSMQSEQLGEEIEATQKMTNKPFGVNLILLHPDIDDLIDCCISKKVEL